MRLATAVAVTLLCASSNALAQSDSLLCITGQPGESTLTQRPPVATCFSCDSTTTGDCDDFRSDPDAWDLGEEGPLYRIPLVFHVLMDSAGIGDLSDSLIAVQIDMLNEGFMNSVGSFSQGEPTRIMFRLAGINRVENTDWFYSMSRGGLYTMTDSIVGASIYWDTSRYFNVVTMCGVSPECGGLGTTTNGTNYPWFAAGWPWFDSARIQFDGIGDPFGGRILIHEAGHYLGLYHIEEHLCNPSCSSDGNRTGDLADDTAPYPINGCYSYYDCVHPGDLEACGVPYPDFNDYLQATGTVACWNHFTGLQVGRMRCGLKTYRPALYDSIVVAISADAILDTVPVCPAGDAYPLIVTVDLSQSTIHADSIGAAEITLDLPDETLFKLWDPTDTPLPTPRRVIADSAATADNDFTTTITHRHISGCDDGSVTVLLNGVPIGDAHFSIRSFDYHTSSPGHVDTADLAHMSADLDKPAPDSTVTCSEFAPPINGDVTASDLSAFAAHFGDVAPEYGAQKPAYATTELRLSESGRNGDQASLAIGLENATGMSVLGFVLRPQPGSVEYLGWQAEPALEGATHAVALTDARGPKVVVLLLDGRGVRGQEVPLGSIGLRVLRGDVDDVAAHVTVEFAQLQALDGSTLTLGTSGKTLVEPLPVFVTSLEQNVPNPFNPATEIRYGVAHESPVTLAIYNVQGRLIRWLVDADQPAGRYRVSWDGKDQQGNQAPSGIYLYKLTAGSVKQMRKLVLVR